MKRLFRVKYPKILALIFSIFLAYFIFDSPYIRGYVSSLGSLNLLGVFIAGILFSFGFSAPIATGFFIVLKPENILLYAIIGGIGSAIGNLSIFKMIQISFTDEFKRLKNEKVVMRFNGWLEKDFGVTLTHYLIYALAGFMLASPLPDEFGMIMLAGLTRIKASILVLVSFILHAIGIYLLFLI